MTLEELEVVVKGNTTDVVKKLENLKAQIQDSIQGSIQKATAQAQPDFNALKQSFDSVSVAVAGSTSKSIKSFEILGREIELQKRKVQELRKQYEAFNTYKSLNSKLENREISLKEYSNMRSNLPHNIKDVSVQLEQAEIQLAKMTLRADNMKSKMAQAGESAKQAGKKVSQSMNKASDDIQKATKHSSKFLQTFKRIIRVMIVKGIINQAIQGFNDLTKASDEYNQSMSHIQASMLQARNAITTAFAPALQMLEPYIVKFAEIVTDLFTTIAMYTSAFAGNNFYYRATKVTTDYAKSLGKASDAQQKLLAGFDELNVLQDKQNGGGATGLPSASEQFEKVDIPQDVLDNVANFKQKLEELLPILETIGALIAGYEIGKLFGLWGKGTSLVDKLTGAFKDKNSALGDQQGEYAKEYSWLKDLIPKFVTSAISVWALSSALGDLKNNPIEMPSLQPVTDLETAFDTAKNNINESMEGAKESVTRNVNESMEKVTEAIPVIDTAVSTAGDTIIETATNTEANVSAINKRIIDTVETDSATITDQIETATTEQENKVAESCTNMAESAETMSQDIQKSFTNFIVGTGQNIATWIATVISPAIALMRAMNSAGDEEIFNLSGVEKALSYAKEQVKSVAKNIIDPIKNKISSEMRATQLTLNIVGQNIGNWAELAIGVGAKQGWERIKSGASLVAPFVAGAYALTTGDTSMLEKVVPALASGGVLSQPTLALIGEYSGANANPEIVAPQDLMLETNLKANVPVMNAIEEMGDKLVGALNNIGVYAEFDYSKLKVGLDNENAKVGGKLYGV